VVLAPNGEVKNVNRPVFEYFGPITGMAKERGTSDAVHPEAFPVRLSV